MGNYTGALILIFVTLGWGFCMGWAARHWLDKRKAEALKQERDKSSVAVRP